MITCFLIINLHIPTRPIYTLMLLEVMVTIFGKVCLPYLLALIPGKPWLKNIYLPQTILSIQVLAELLWEK
jgi:hypothetical protein